MKKFLNNKKGLMGIDYIAVAGVVLTLTVFILSNFYPSGKIVAEHGIDQLNQVATIATPTTVTP